jgi:hypothetical protein
MGCDLGVSRKLVSLFEFGSSVTRVPFYDLNLFQTGVFDYNWDILNHKQAICNFRLEMGRESQEVRVLMRWRRALIYSFTAVLLLMSAGIVSARELLEGERCSIEAGTVIAGDLFVFCNELNIAGKVEGNLIGLARTVMIEGEIGGSVYVIGGELELTGTLGKDLHFIGLILSVEHGSYFVDERGSILTANLSHSIEPGVVVPGSVLNAGYQLLVKGEIGQEVNFWGSALNIAGRVGGDVTAAVGSSDADGASSQIETLLLPFPFQVTLVDPGLVLLEEATIDGTLEYTGQSVGFLEGSVGREIIFQSTAIEPIMLGAPVEESARSLQLYGGQVLQEVLTLGLIGVALLLVAPRQMQAPLRSLQTRPLSTLGMGMISFVLSFPIVLIFAVLSLLIVFILSLLPMHTFVIFGGVVLGLVNIGWASVFYFTAIYIARLIFALAVGRLVVYVLFDGDGSLRYQLASLGIGVLILGVLGSIPVVGWGFNALALFLGLGAILTVLQTQFHRFRASGEAGTPSPGEQVPLLPYFAGDGQQFTTPVIEDAPPEVGLDDLPDGFDWWGEDDPRQ